MINNQEIDIEDIKQKLVDAMQSTGLSAEVFGYLGEMADDVIRDKTLYPKFVTEIVISGLAERDDFSKNIDYQALVVFSTLGKVAKTLGAQNTQERT